MQEVTKKLSQLRAYAQKEYIPVMREATAKILEEWLKKSNPKSILEIGTSIGTSGILSLAILQEAYLVTIEKDINVQNQARANLKELGLLKRANLILGDCFEVLMLMKGEFDFIIFDGPKGHNKELLELTYPLLKPKGIIFVDNINYHNKTKLTCSPFHQAPPTNRNGHCEELPPCHCEEFPPCHCEECNDEAIHSPEAPPTMPQRESDFLPHKHRTIVRNIRKFLHFINTNDKLHTTFYDDGDGIAVIEKIK